jgi:hypothetical protein
MFVEERCRLGVDDSRNWPEALGQHRSKGIRGERHVYGCANVAPMHALRAIGDPTPRQDDVAVADSTAVDADGVIGS